MVVRLNVSPELVFSMQRRAPAHSDQRKDGYEQHRKQGNERRRRVNISGPPDVTVMAGDLHRKSPPASGSIDLGSMTAAYMTAGNTHVERSPRFSGLVQSAERRKYNANTR